MLALNWGHTVIFWCVGSLRAKGNPGVMFRLSLHNHAWWPVFFECSDSLTVAESQRGREAEAPLSWLSLNLRFHLGITAQCAGHRVLPACSSQLPVGGLWSTTRRWRSKETESRGRVEAVSGQEERIYSVTAACLFIHLAAWCHMPPPLPSYPLCALQLGLVFSELKQFAHRAGLGGLCSGKRLASPPCELLISSFSAPHHKGILFSFICCSLFYFRNAIGLSGQALWSLLTSSYPSSSLPSGSSCVTQRLTWSLCFSLLKAWIPWQLFWCGLVKVRFMTQR